MALGSSAVAFTATATDIDFDAGDQVRLVVSSHHLQNFEITRAGGKVVELGTPENYVLGDPISSSQQFFVFDGLTWEAPTVGGTENFTLKAIDADGLESNTVTVTLTITADNPPSWVTVPLAQGPIEQGGVFDVLTFELTDIDASQRPNLVVTVEQAPTRGTLELTTTTPGGSVIAIPTAGFSLTSIGNSAYVVMSTANPERVVFRVRYTPSSSYVGTDSFSFRVTDPTLLYAVSNPVVVSYTRAPTPPVSRSVDIYALEGELTSWTMIAESTNPDNPSPIPASLVLDSFSVGMPDMTLNGVHWQLGQNSPTVTRGVNLDASLTPPIGFYSEEGVPTGTFTYRAYEPTNNLTSGTYVGRLFVTHVNQPPVSEDIDRTIRKREVLAATLAANDPDVDDPASTIVSVILSVRYHGTGTGRMYYDEEMLQPVETATLGRVMTGRQFWYQSDDDYDANAPLCTFTFRVIDKEGRGLNSPVYNGAIRVLPAGDVPVAGNLDTYIAQEAPTPIPLGNVTTESGEIPVITITSLPTKGLTAVAPDNGGVPIVLTQGMLPYTLPATVSGARSLRFTGRAHDWSYERDDAETDGVLRTPVFPQEDEFTHFEYTMLDPDTQALGTYTMRIHVWHVNKRPSIAAANFVPSTGVALVLNESTSRVFDWYGHDTDDMPGVVRSVIRISAYTSQGFALYSCEFVTGDWNTPAGMNCSFADTVPFATRADFVGLDAKRMLDSIETVSTDCATPAALKARLGAPSRQCEAHFRMVFVPTPFASSTPFATITWTSIDSYNEESTPISTLIFVKAVNDPPTIWAPPQVVGTAGIANPFIRDTDQTSATFNNPVRVADVDANGAVEELTIRVLPGFRGNLTWPASAPCAASTTEQQTWVCRDRVGNNIGFAVWLQDLRFHVLSGDRANIEWTINDLGNSGDYKPSPHLTATARTTVIIAAGVKAPTGNSSTLAIAVGVAAAAGLLLLGALGFFLRNAASPPTDDYFAAATAPISAAPQSPLYQAQNTEHMSPLYKGSA